MADQIVKHPPKLTFPSSTFSGQSATDNSKQHVGNNYSTTSYNYTVRERRSDESAREIQRDKALLRAAAEGQTPRVRYLVHLGADLDFADDHGLTSLHYAVLNGNEDAVDLIIELGADVNADSALHGTPLCIAAVKDRHCIAQKLIRNRAIVNRTQSAHENPLHCAAWAGSVAMVKLLLAHGADVELMSVTTIHASSKENSLVPEGYIDHGTITEVEYSPLFVAAHQGRGLAVETLLEHGAGIAARNEHGWNAMHAAASQGHLDTVKLLVARGLSVADETALGDNALVVAVQRGHYDTVQYILEQGINTNKTASSSDSALLYAVSRGSVPTVELLLKHSAHSKARTTNLRTALEMAVSKGQTALVMLLIRQGVDIAATHACELHPVVYAVCAGHLQLLQTLLTMGAPIEYVSSDGNTLLHYAAESGQQKVLALLLSRGCQINKTNDLGYTALHLAANYGRAICVRNLLRCGADSMIFANNGWTARDVTLVEPRIGDWALAERMLRKHELAAEETSVVLASADKASTPTEESMNQPTWLGHWLLARNMAAQHCVVILRRANTPVAMWACALRSATHANGKRILISFNVTRLTSSQRMAALALATTILAMAVVKHACCQQQLCTHQL